MEIHRQLLVCVFLCIGAFPVITHGEETTSNKPAESVRKTINIDGAPHELSETAKKTLEILRAEKFDTITLDRLEPQKAFQILKDHLAKRSVTVRLKHYGNPQVYEPGDPLKLRNIPLDKFMWYFDQIVHWGWIIYPDGSITYFDNQCACCWPKNFGCHESQYEAGKPEVMAKEQKVAPEKPRAEQ